MAEEPKTIETMIASLDELRTIVAELKAAVAVGREAKAKEPEPDVKKEPEPAVKKEPEPDVKKEPEPEEKKEAPAAKMTIEPKSSVNAVDEAYGM